MRATGVEKTARQLVAPCHETNKVGENGNIPHPTNELVMERRVS